MCLGVILGATVTVSGCVADPVRGSRVEDLTSAGTGAPPGSVVETSEEPPDPTVSLRPTVAGVSTPTTLSVPPPSGSMSSSPSSAPATTHRPSDPEAEAKREIEKVWLQYWRIYTTSTAMTQEDLKAAIGTVAVDPIRTDVIKEWGYFRDRGLENYGTVRHHIAWSGKRERFALGVVKGAAYIGDCLDESSFGSRYVSTMKKRTKGFEKELVVGEFTRDSIGSWKIRQLYYLTSTAC
ncbi:hypothetical protein D1871_21310 [Nakamurella silvestris]|nr:hypothetical protein D1871_21310 [Nakamurella silvestris]